jgi:AbrB family looped-hinge helix DNA binding protein
MSTATISSKGQVTLPIDVRKAMGVGPGDRVDFVKMEDGHFAVMPATVSVMSLKGILSPPATPVTLEDMDAAVRAGAKDS